MAKHNPGDEGLEPPELSRVAFLKSLLHVEGLQAAELLRSQLAKLLFSRGGGPGLASEQSGEP